MSSICDAHGALVLAGSFQFSFEIGHAADRQWERSSQSSPRQQSVETLRVVASMFGRGEWSRRLRMSQDVSANYAGTSFRSRRRDREEEGFQGTFFGAHG